MRFMSSLEVRLLLTVLALLLAVAQVCVSKTVPKVDLLSDYFQNLVHLKYGDACRGPNLGTVSVSFTSDIFDKCTILPRIWFSVIRL